MLGLLKRLSLISSILCLSCASHAWTWGSSLILLCSASNLPCEYLMMFDGKELMGGCRISWWLWFPIFEIALPINVGLLKFILVVYPVSSHSCQWFLPYPPASPLETKARIDLFSQEGPSL